MADPRLSISDRVYSAVSFSRKRVVFVLGANPFSRKVVAARLVAQDGLDAFVVAVLAKVNRLLRLVEAGLVSVASRAKWNQLVLRALIDFRFEVSMAALHFAQRRLEFAVHLCHLQSGPVSSQELF